MQSTVLARADWQARAAAHAERVDVWVQPHLERRRRGIAHPVHDFLFDYVPTCAISSTINRSGSL